MRRWAWWSVFFALFHKIKKVRRPHPRGVRGRSPVWAYRRRLPSNVLVSGSGSWSSLIRGLNTGTETRERHAGRWRMASCLAGGGVPMASLSIFETNDDMWRGCGLSCPLMCNDRCRVMVMAERGSSSCSSPRWHLEEFLFLGLFALSALECWCMILLELVSGCLSSVFGCCMWNTVCWILREMTLSMGAMLGSIVDMGSATVLGFWTSCTYFLRCGRLESWSVDLASVAKQRCVPSWYFWLQFRSAKFAPGKTRSFFHESHEAGVVMMIGWAQHTGDELN